MTISVRKAKPLRGEFTVPGDKSITHRALMLSALGDGTSTLTGWLDAADPRSTIRCLRELGANIEMDQQHLLVHGNPSRVLRAPGTVLDAGNSGTTMRLLAGILAGQQFESVLSGDEYLTKRPMKRIMEPLGRMGASIGASSNSTAPLRIKGRHPLTAITYELPVASAQVKSAILLAGLFADGETTVIEGTPSRDHTERMMGIAPHIVNEKRHLSITPDMRIPARDYAVPADISSAMFLVSAAILIPGSDCILRNVGLNPTRVEPLKILREWGASISVSDVRESGGEQLGTIRVSSSNLAGECAIDASRVPLLIDEIPILAVTAACSRMSFSVRGAAELRAKESDRIHLIVANLRLMNVDVDEHEDGFAFQAKKTVLPPRIETGGDHRIAMAFGVAACMADGPTEISDAESAEISFPGFWNLLSTSQH